MSAGAILAPNPRLERSPSDWDRFVMRLAPPLDSELDFWNFGGPPSGASVVGKSPTDGNARSGAQFTRTKNTFENTPA
jgi:hypothetical protein